MFPVLFAKKLAEPRDVASESSFVDVSIRPDPLHELVLIDEVAWIFNKNDQGVEKPFRQRQDLALAYELSLGYVQTEVFKLKKPSFLKGHLSCPNFV
jgi:hypothetical protein